MTQTSMLYPKPKPLNPNDADLYSILSGSISWGLVTTSSGFMPGRQVQCYVSWSFGASDGITSVSSSVLGCLGVYLNNPKP